MKWYIATLKRDFARYGFVSTPLTDAQLTALYKQNIKLDQAYGIGCDVAAGFSFEEAVSADTNKEEKEDA
jgi:hypothetical protein